MKDFSLTSPDGPGFQGFDGFSLYSSPEAPVCWPREFHSQVEVVVPLGTANLTLTTLENQTESYQSFSFPDVGLVPAQQVHQLHLSEPSQLLILFLEPQFITAASQGFLVAQDWNPERHYIQEDPVIRYVGQALFEAHQSAICFQALEEERSVETGMVLRDLPLYRMTLVRLLAIHLVERYARSERKSRSVAKKLPYVRLTPILAYIHDNLDQDLKVATLADLAELSPPHFCRLFKQTTGLSPYRYVLSQRIALAKKLLRQTSLTLADIVFRCGFYDQSHFNLQFRNHIGMTPRAYRDRDA